MSTKWQIKEALYEMREEKRAARDREINIKSLLFEVVIASVVLGFYSHSILVFILVFIVSSVCFLIPYLKVAMSILYAVGWGYLPYKAMVWGADAPDVGLLFGGGLFLLSLFIHWGAGALNNDFGL